MISKRIAFQYGLLFALSFPVYSVNAQQRILDSLKNILAQKSISSHQRAMTMVRLADASSFANPSLRLGKNNEALAYATENDDKPAASFAYSSRVVLYVLSGKTTLAQNAVDSALYLAKSAPSLFKGIAWNRKGYLENIQNKPDEALKSWQKALDYLNEPEGALYQANIYYLLYGIYAERNDNANATSYARQSLKKALESKDASMITAAWQINGTDYLQSFQTGKDSVFIDSAIYAFKQSVKVFRAKKDWIKNQSVVSLSALNLADIYMDYYPPWYKDSIMNYVNLALKTSFASGNKVMQANCYDIIGKLNQREGNLDLAEKALLKEKELVDSITPINYYLSLNLYQSLAQLKEQQGSYAAALGYYKSYIDFYQKEFNAQQFQSIQQLEAKYQNEKKDKELKLLQQRNKFQKKQTYLYFGIALIAIAGLLFLFLAYHFRLKYSLQREKLLQKEKNDANLLAQLRENETIRLKLEKHEAELQSKFNTEEAGRLQAEQKLMISQKEQLQKELLAGVLQVEHKNELLKNLKEKLLFHAEGGNPARKLEKIINEELHVDEGFENIKSEFKEIHPEFFTHLQAQTKQKLSQLDLKYCAYIYMQLSSKQIALLLHVEPKSVSMTRYRLKQKLGLGKEEELGEFIRQFNGEKM
ncbi:MAG: tetratricopeptide repeat protein [Ginsengibacter sp.]